MFGLKWKHNILYFNLPNSGDLFNSLTQFVLHSLLSYIYILLYLIKLQHS